MFDAVRWSAVAWRRAFVVGLAADAMLAIVPGQLVRRGQWFPRGWQLSSWVKSTISPPRPRGEGYRPTWGEDWIQARP